MNLIGKIFTVLAFIMSLVFMAFSIAVYATHRNFREEILRAPDKTLAGQEKGLKFQIQDLSAPAPAKGRLESLQDQKTNIVSELTREQASRQQMVAMLEVEMVEARLRREALIAEEQKAVLDTAAAVDEKKKTQDAIDALRAEIEMYRTDINTAKQNRDLSFEKVLVLEDKLAQVLGEWERLRKRNEELAKDVARYSTSGEATGQVRPGAPVAGN